MDGIVVEFPVQACLVPVSVVLGLGQGGAQGGGHIGPGEHAPQLAGGIGHGQPTAAGAVHAKGFADARKREHVPGAEHRSQILPGHPPQKQMTPGQERLGQAGQPGPGLAVPGQDQKKTHSVPGQFTQPVEQENQAFGLDVRAKHEIL